MILLLQVVMENTQTSGQSRQKKAMSKSEICLRPLMR